MSKFTTNGDDDDGGGVGGSDLMVVVVIFFLLGFPVRLLLVLIRQVPSMIASCIPFRYK